MSKWKWLDYPAMNKTHQIWQRLNLVLGGFFLGSRVHTPEHLTIWLGLVWTASTLLEALFNKRDVSDWRTR